MTTNNKFVLQYKVVFSDAYGRPDSEVLSEKVDSHIDAGWQPFGSPFAYAEGIAQAVVIFSEE
jgi:hypothetical protein